MPPIPVERELSNGIIIKSEQKIVAINRKYFLRFLQTSWHSRHVQNEVQALDGLL